MNGTYEGEVSEAYREGRRKYTAMVRADATDLLDELERAGLFAGPYLGARVRWVEAAVDKAVGVQVDTYLTYDAQRREVLAYSPSVPARLEGDLLGVAAAAYAQDLRLEIQRRLGDYASGEDVEET
jgi:hypothetical protein